MALHPKRRKRIFWNWRLLTCYVHPTSKRWVVNLTDSWSSKIHKGRSWKGIRTSEKAKEPCPRGAGAGHRVTSTLRFLWDLLSSWMPMSMPGPAQASKSWCHSSSGHCSIVEYSVSHCEVLGRLVTTNHGSHMFVPHLYILWHCPTF